MAPKLYMVLGSPPVRAVLLCAKAIGLELELKEVDVFKGEHLKPEYLKLNPQHTIPTLEDEGFILWDSHAIMPYLVAKYGKDKSLYPEDIQKRAIIDQRLHFDSNVLFIRGFVISKNLLIYGKTEITEEEEKPLKEAYEFVEKFLENNDWIAGDSLSIADFSFVSTITSWSVLVPIEESHHPRICRWLKRMKTLPYYKEANIPGNQIYEEAIRSRVKK